VRKQVFLPMRPLRASRQLFNPAVSKQLRRLNNNHPPAARILFHLASAQQLIGLPRGGSSSQQTISLVAGCFSARRSTDGALSLFVLLAGPPLGSGYVADEQHRLRRHGVATGGDDKGRRRRARGRDWRRGEGLGLPAGKLPYSGRSCSIFRACARRRGREKKPRKLAHWRD
jgi:hypothetical protein